MVAGDVAIKPIEIKGDGDGTTEEEGDEVDVKSPPPTPRKNNPSAFRPNPELNPTYTPIAVSGGR